MKSSISRNPITPVVAIALAIAGQSLNGSAATVPVADIFGHNEQDNFGQGFISDMINGSGMNDNDADGVVGWPAGEGDPSTWAATSSQWQAEWQSRDLLGDGEEGEDLPTNGKIGWAIFDLGGSFSDLENLYLWNQRENNGRFTASFNVYLAETPSVAPVHGPTNGSSIDYDFSSGGWTLINTGGPLSGTFRGDQVVSLGGGTGRYVAIEILANNGDTERVGLAEVAITRATADSEPPTLTDIVDDQGGASVSVNTRVTYTVTFSEDMDANTVSDADFDNAGTAEVAFGSVTETAPGVFEVEVTPTTEGTLQLRVPVGASITDASGNLLDNDPAILDDATITVTADVTPPTLAPSDIVDDQGGGAVLAGTLVTYTVSFSKDMDDSTVGADDFGNAGTAAVLFGSVAETAPGVFSVEVTPTLAGSLQLQVLMGAELSDAAGNPLDTGAAIADDNTIVVSEPTGGTSVVTVAEVFAHNEQDNFGQGFVMDMLNGSGMNGNGNDDVPGWPAVGGDPSMWVATSNAWQAEWQSRDLLGDGDEGEDLPTNGKIGWVIYDLGEATADLDSLYIWNQRENAGRYTASFNVYTATSPAVAPVHGPTNSSSIDYDFSSGGWTIVNPGAPLSGTYQGEQVVLLGGRTARYVAIEILANNGDANRVGLAEIAVTAGNLGGGGDDFSDWIAMFPGVGSETGIGDDPDGDGVESGVENFFGTAPDVFTQGLVATSGSGDTFTFTHPQGTLADDLTAIYRWSTDLQSFYAGGSAAPSGLRVDFSVTPDSPNPGTTTVTATISGGETGRLFVDVEVTQ